MRLNNPLVLIPFPQKQKTQSVCPREAGSFWDMPPSPEEGQKRPSAMFIGHPFCTFYHVIWQKICEFLLFCCESEINPEHSGFFHWSSGVWADLVMDLTTMSLTYLIHFICLWVVSMWYICQQLRLCVFLQFDIVIPPCFSGCWQLLQPVTFKKAHSRSPEDRYLSCSNSFLSHSIHYMVQSEKLHPTDNTQEAKAAFQLGIFCACTYSLILCAFQVIVSKN